ncbi:hypothetical protein ABZ208_34485 [Streptomyces sp. NPDC006208]|uniref:hypothetical protein n=1 Tax=Streptomyces sp. NPDC006208 TaxID=3156734 RepID=UPI0033B3432D
MSITSPIPVLQDRDGTVLSAESEGLVLERPREELTIPTAAISRVRAEGRSVAVELRALAGATPSVHRIEDVSEAAATVFADAVNALLPERTEEIDGSALVVLRTLTPSRREKFMRSLKWFVFGCLGVVVAVCVTAGIAGDAGLAIAVVPIGVITTAGLGVGVYCVWTWNRERRLLKHGITVVASPANRPGAYLYTDSAGMTRVLSHWGVEPYVRAGYNPQDPSDVLVPQAPFMRRFNITLGAFILFCGLNGVALLAFMIVDTLSGGGI